MKIHIILTLLALVMPSSGAEIGIKLRDSVKINAKAQTDLLSTATEMIKSAATKVNTSYSPERFSVRTVDPAVILISANGTANDKDAKFLQSVISQFFSDRSAVMKKSIESVMPTLQKMADAENDPKVKDELLRAIKSTRSASITTDPTFEIQR